MNPIKVFLSIFGAGIVLVVILGVVGMYQDPTGLAGDNEEEQEEEPGVVQLTDIPASIQNNCLSCHGQNLDGGPGAPSLMESGLSEEELITIISEGQGAMPSFSDTFSDQEIGEIATYLLDIRDRAEGEETNEGEPDDAGEGGEETDNEEAA